jgi:hypothetical protein
VGALHPILFFAGVYFVALFFSIFICSSVFYSCNTSGSATAAGKQIGTELKGTETAMVIVNK